MYPRLWKKFTSLARYMKKPLETQEIRKENEVEQPISPNLDNNISMLKDLFQNCSDVVFREFTLGTRKPVRATLVYIDGLCEADKINQHILKSLMLEADLTTGNLSLDKSLIQTVRKRLLTIGDVKTTKMLQKIVTYILSGDPGLFLDGCATALIPNARGWESRGISEPESETVVRGPRDGFTENLRTNATLLRRRIKTSRLKFEAMEIGLLTKTVVNIAYIQGIANEKVVEEVRNRLQRIDVDSILESGYIEELIEDSPFSIFPQINATERPDRVVSGLLEGQVAILVDNTPFGLLAPVTFPQFLQAAEDYYLRYPLVLFMRLLRFVSLNISLLLPSVYIAVTTYHQEMLPTPLLISIAAAREGVPFPALVEALAMEFTFEILKEAGVRLPRQVGQAVSIVGALVIGDAAVTAGLVSPAMVIVVSLTAISSFTIPNYTGSTTIRLLRFPIMLLAGTLGFYGIMVALMALLIHLCSLRSFGVPYLSPLAPLSLRDLKDTFIRVPWWAMFTRPRLIGTREPARQDYISRPGPGRGKTRTKPTPYSEGGHHNAGPREDLQ